MRLRSSLIALSLSLVCLVPRVAMADSTSITLTSVPGGSTAGVYVYPYDFTVANGSSSQQDVFLSCLNFNREVTFGETWAVDPVNLSTVSASGTYDGESGATLLEDAVLFNLYGTSAGTDSEINFAIWSIMDPGDINASNATYTGANAFDATAQALAANAIAQVTSPNPLPASFFATDVALLPDPTDSSAWTNGEPQIFMMDPPPPATPEPGSLLLLGTGFGALGIAVAATSKRRAGIKETPIGE